MMECRAPWILLLLSSFGGPGLSARAEEPVDEKARADASLAFAEKAADEYRFRLDGSVLTPFKREPQPILRWSNPIAGSVHGSVYLWTYEGRPTVVASFYKWYQPFTHRANEFQSLATAKIVGERDGQSDWAPNRAGVEFKPIAGTSVPGATPSLRLRQMRDLATEFTGSLTDRPKVGIAKPVARDLRLLTQPVYRYQGTNGTLIDGALFAFVLGTDPEVFLMIEARDVGAKLTWEYALARMNSSTLSISHRGQGVWKADMIPWPQVKDRQEPHTSFEFRSEEGAATP